MFDGRDTIVIDDKLAYEDLLPVRWRQEPAAPADVQATHFAERNLRVLQACDALEEHGQLDKKKADDDSPHSADIMRLDFKLNVLLDLVGQLLAQSQPRPQSTQIRFNAMGATWKSGEPLRVGTYGILEITLRDVIVQPLHLPAEVVAGADAGFVRVRFLSLGETVADHIEKLVFRRHRRKIAGARQQTTRR
ncbi:MAG TPA: PilZ domain-containing protein [Steroidobacteraceae bacterium]|nr:PilZ domain-containing protein [Steroidobacteraceae bacterium]